MKIKLVVQYVGKPTNRTERMHWAERYRDQKKAWLALSSALLATASDQLIQILSPDAAKICSTGYATLGLFMEMNRGKSSSKPSKKRSIPGPKKGPR